MEYDRPAECRPEKNCSRLTIITIEFMFLDINMFWNRLRLILTRDARQGKINSVTLIITLESTEIIEKKLTRQSKSNYTTIYVLNSIYFWPKLARNYIIITFLGIVAHLAG